VARIYSGYLPALVFVACVDLSLVHRSLPYEFRSALNVPTFVANLFMLQDFPGDFLKHSGAVLTSFGSARPFWTLAIEMWIYAFVGAVVLFGQKPGLRTRGLLLAALFAYVPVANLFGGRGRGLFACWLLGALAESILYRDLLRRFGVPVIVLAMLGAAAAYGATVWPEREVYRLVSYPLLFVVFTGFLALTLRIAYFTSHAWLRGMVSYFAGYSFTLYLVHYTVLTACLSMSKSRTVVAMWIAIGVANLVALVIAHFTERRHHAFARSLERWLPT
jgi:peptidoglycan/LPS O-acetylase OafA/YrhL